MLDVRLELEHVADIVEAMVLIDLVIEAMVPWVMSKRLSDLLISGLLPSQISYPRKSPIWSTSDFQRPAVFSRRHFPGPEGQNQVNRRRWIDSGCFRKSCGDRIVYKKACILECTDVRNVLAREESKKLVRS